jgi:hypothetical protein
MVLFRSPKSQTTSSRSTRLRSLRRRVLKLEMLEDRRLLTVSLPEFLSINNSNSGSGSGASDFTEMSLSGDGRFKVFSSHAADLVAGDLNNAQDVFLRDLQLGTTILVSRATEGGTANSSSHHAVISADGEYVAFYSYATNLDVTGLTSTNGWAQVYRWHRSSGVIELVTPNASLDDGATFNSFNPSISGDGNRISFLTLSENLISGINDTNGIYWSGADVYVRDMSTDTTLLVSRSFSDPIQTANNQSHGQQISRDGSKVVYQSSATDIQLGVTDLNGAGWDLVAFEVATQTNSYVVLQTAESSTGNAGSSRTDQSLSADGRYEVFSSDASDLVSGDTNQTPDVFLRDLVLGTTTLISRGFGGNAANSSSYHAVISADGEYVAFYSYATNLDVTGLNSTNRRMQVYRWHRTSGTIELVTPNAGQDDGATNNSYNPSISGDGNRISFLSQSDDLIAGINDVNGVSWEGIDVYVRDMSTDTTMLVSRSASDPNQTANRQSDGQQISRDGSMVVYRSSATDIQSGVIDLNGSDWDLIAFELATQTNSYVVTQTAEPSSGNAGSLRTDQSLSADGRYEVFSSDASDLVSGDTNKTPDIFLRDLVLGTTTLISRGFGGNAANSSSHHAAISADGEYVAFYSYATNLDVTGLNSTNGWMQVYRWHRTSGTIELVTPNADQDNGATYSSYNPSISGDGNRISFLSQSDNLVAGINDVNGVYAWWNDVYVRDMSMDTTILVSRSSSNPNQTANGRSDVQRISRDGSRVVYRSSATDIQSGVTDLNGSDWDLVAFELATQTNSYVVTQTTEPSSGNSVSSRTGRSLSADGRYEVFSSDASDLVSGDTNQTIDVFLRDIALGTTTLISRAVGGGAANSGSIQAVISADGEYVAFYSFATNLDVTGLNSTNGSAQVYRWHRTSGMIELVTPNASEDGGASYNSRNPSISGDGNRISFLSQSDNLISGINDVNGAGWSGMTDVYVRDMAAGTTMLVSRSYSDPNQTSNNQSEEHQISRDGSTVVLRTLGSDLSMGVTDNNSNWDLFAFDIDSEMMVAVSLAMNGTSTGDYGVHTTFSLSNNGQVIAFSSSASDIHPLKTNTLLDVFVRDLSVAFNGVELISMDSFGVKGNSHSARPSISGDGNYVAFDSAATNLNPLSNSGVYEIFVRERSTSITRLISVNSDGTAGGNNWSSSPRISRDGSTITFISTATNLDANVIDENGAVDVFVRNWQSNTPTTVLISRSTSGTGSGNEASQTPVLSDSGSILTFESNATNLVAGVADSNGNTNDIFVYNGTNVELVSKKGGGSFTGRLGVEASFSISDTGNWIAFASSAPGITTDTYTGTWQVYVRDLANETTELVSVNINGDAGNSASIRPSISGDGNYVAFDSSATNFDPLAPNWWISNVFVRNRLTSTTHLVSISSDGTAAGDSTSYSARISRDGSTIAFLSSATNLDSNVIDENGLVDVFFRNWQSNTPTTVLISRDSFGALSGNGVSTNPVLSDSGSILTFESNATNLLSGIFDSNGSASDVFVFNGTNVELVSKKGGGSFTGRSGVETSFSISDTGNWIAFASSVPGITNDGYIGTWQVYVRDVANATTELVSINNNGDAGNSASFRPSISGDGNYVAFDSSATNFDPLAPYWWISNVFVRNRLASTTHLVSISSDGTAAGDSTSYSARISRDGSTVAFLSSASNLDTNTTDSNGTFDIFVRNWQSNTPTTVLVSRDSVGALSGNGASTNPVLSDSGSILTFESNATNLLLGSFDSNGSASDVFVFSGTDIELVSKKGGGSFTGRSGVEASFSISDTGNWIAFSSSAPGITTDTYTGTWQVYVRDLANENTELVSVNNNGDAGNSASFRPSISGDGNYVAFDSSATNFDPFAPNWWISNIFVRNRLTSMTHLVSISSDGTAAGDSTSYSARISRDGSTIAFLSSASNLDGNTTDSNGTVDAFLRKWQSPTPVTDLISREYNGASSADGASIAINLSENGITVAFASYATNHTALTDANITYDVFAVRAAAISVSSTDSSKFEADSGLTEFTFTIQREWFTGNEVTVEWTISGLGATPAQPSDFGGSYPNGNVVFAAGETVKLVTILVSGDMNVEVDEGFLITLRNSNDNSQIVSPTAAGLILNNDIDLEIAALSSVHSEGHSGTIAYTYTVTRIGYLGIPTTVDWNIIGHGTNPANSADFGGSWPVGQVLFAIGSTSQVITVLVHGDQMVEMDEQFGIVVANPSPNAEINVSIATGTIQNDDSAVINIENVSKLEGSGGGTTAYTFNVTIDNPVDVAVTLQADTANGTALAGSDYTSVVASSVSFAAGSTTTQQVTVQVNSDNLVELNEAFSLVLSSLGASGRSVSLGTATGTGTIQNDDSAVINIGNVSKLEGSGGGTTAYTFNVTIDNPVDIAVTLQADTANGTALAGSDYTSVVASSVSFAAGSTTTQQVTVQVNSDNLVELNEAFSVILSSLGASGRSVTLGTATGTGTIQNDDSAVINIGNVSKLEGSGGGTTAYTFNVTIDNPVDVAVTLEADTANGTALAGSDYTSVVASSVSFAAGSTTTQQVTVQVNADNLVELNEAFSVILSSLGASGRSVTLGTATGTGTIQNDDSAVINIGNVSKLEGSGGGTTAYTFNVTIDNPVDVAVTLEADTANGTALASSDYTSVVASSVSFAAGSTTTQQVTVQVNADNLVELNEAFSLVLSSLGASGRSVSLGTATGTGTIQNDDSAVINIGNVSKLEGSGGGTTAYTFNVTIDNPVDVAVTLQADTANGTALAGSDYTSVVASSVSFATGSTTTQQVTVQVNSDNLVELNEAFSLVLSSLGASGRSVSLGTATGTGTIQNDDSAVINIGNVSKLEGSGGGTTAYTFNVTIDNPVDVAVTLQADTANGTALAGSDYTSVVASSVSFATGSTTTQQVTVQVNSDNLVELNEAFSLVLSSLGASGRSVSLGTATGTATGTGTIQNDDSAVINIGNVSKLEGSGGGTTAYTFNVTIDNPVDVAVTLQADTANGTALAGSDYTSVVASSVAFATGSTTTQQVTVQVNADNLVELNEAFSLILSSLGASGRSVSLGTATGTGTIQNDDSAVINIGNVSKLEGSGGGHHGLHL